jgi:hypothetical protein
MHYLSANVSGGLFAIATFSALAYQCPQLLASSTDRCTTFGELLSRCAGIRHRLLRQATYRDL